MDDTSLQTITVHVPHCVYEIDAGGTRFNQSTQDPKAVLTIDINLPPSAVRLKGTIEFGDFTSPSTVEAAVHLLVDGKGPVDPGIVQRGTPYVLDLDVTSRSSVTVVVSIPETVQLTLKHADILLAGVTYIKPAV